MQDWRACVLSGGLVLSAVAKFVTSLRAAGEPGIQVLGRQFGEVEFLAIAVLEAVIAALLLTRFVRRAGHVSLVLFSAFGLLSLFTWLMGEDLTQCGCFGDIELPVVGHLLLVAGGILLSLELADDVTPESAVSG